MHRPLLRAGSLAIDPQGRHVSLRGNQIPLQDTEFDILLTLVESGDFVGYNEISRNVWGDTAARKQIIDMFIASLRKKLAGSDLRIANIDDQGFFIVETS